MKADNIFIEAESFDKKGGWVLDNQSMGQMGSPYLLAHGLRNKERRESSGEVGGR